MVLIKDGVKVELDNEAQIAAFKNAGYTEYTAPDKDAKPKK